MAGVSMEDFERQIELACSKSPIVKSVILFSSTESSNLWRIVLNADSVIEVSFIDVYYSEIIGKTSFAHIKNNQRIFGADNAGGWHWHPYEDPQRHDFVDKEIAFAEFLKRVEENLSK